MRILHERLCLLIFLLVSCSLSALAQNKTITGTVKDASNLGIPGASVVVKGTSTGSITDLDGNFSISVPASTKQLTFSFIGYDSQSVILGSQTKINVVLKESSVMLDEVVAIGYGKMKKRDLTGATSSVQGSEIKSVPVTTAAQALTGRAAGVNITSYSGAPGADVKIVVRGGTSITQDNEPLYIVDGFQMDNALTTINASDIETIDVMKDASSTAIYGAKGSNGVVIITTKSGKAGKTQVSYNGYINFQKLGKKLDVLSPYEYVRLQHEHYTLGKNIGVFNSLYGSWDQMHSLYDNAEAIDWIDLMFGGTGVMYNHDLNISGGNDKTKFVLSYNNTTDNSILDKYGLYRNNIRAKFSHEIRKGVRLDFSANFNDAKTEGGGDLGGRLKFAVLSRPVGGLIHTNDELLNMYGQDAKLLAVDPSLNYDIANPIITNDAITNTKLVRTFDSNGSLEIDLYKGLTYKLAGSYLWQQTRNDYWDDGRTLDAVVKGGPYGSRSNAEKYTYQITNTLTYDTTINQKHNFTLLAGQEVTYSESMNIASGSQNFSESNFGLDNMAMGEVTNNNETSRSSNGIVSLFGRALYNYDSRYLLTATMRADGSSKFAKGKQWGYFPSISGAWRISQEAFMSDQDVFSNLKLRVGYGTSGNCNISDNMYATNYDAGVYGIGKTEIATITPSSTLGNKDLQWETIKATSIGLDMSFLVNRINFSVDWYNNVSDNLLMNVPIPATTGYTSQYQNIGSLRNRGFEFVLNTQNIKTKNFNWSSDLNISFNKNKVIRLYGEDAEQNYMIASTGSNGAAYWVQEGQSLGQIYGYAYDGFYTSNDFDQLSNGTYLLKNGVAYDKSKARAAVKPGDIKFKANGQTIDSDGNPVWTASDRQIIGNANPKFTGGFNNTFTYKNLDLSIFMNFVYGNDVINLSTQRFVSSYISNKNALSILANRYTTIDPSTGIETTDLARLSEINKNAAIWSVNPNVATNTTLNSYYVENGSYLRINNISLGYTFPKALLKKINVENLRVYGTLNNVYTFTSYTGFDPEVTSNSSALYPGIDNSSFPRSKSYVVGLNLTF